jgi:hypothetical protein
MVIFGSLVEKDTTLRLSSVTPCAIENYQTKKRKITLQLISMICGGIQFQLILGHGCTVLLLEDRAV